MQYPGAATGQPVSAAAGFAPAHEYVVLGIPITDQTTAALAWRVMIVSGLMIVIAIVQAYFAIRADDYANVYVLLAFAIPACGYAGARFHKPQFLRLFWVCNGLCACIFVLVLIVNLAVTIPNLNCLCNDECFEDRIDDESISESDREEICSEKSTIMRNIYISLAIGAVGAVLQGFGCSWGKKLEETNFFVQDTDDVPVAPVIGRPIEVRPQPQAQDWAPGSDSSTPTAGRSSGRPYPEQPDA